jgi:hypothetical protein
MSVIHAFFDFIGTWFGFVLSCAASPTGACVPFLAFLALGIAAGASLVLLLLAYRSALSREQGEPPAVTSELDARSSGERVRARAPIAGKPAIA